MPWDEKPIDYYHYAKSEAPHEVAFGEGCLDTMGYYLLYRDKLEEAIAVFRLNAEVYPLSYKVYHSLGMVFMHQGNEKLATQNFQKSLVLNPNYEKAKEMLEKINESKDEK